MSRYFILFLIFNFIKIGYSITEVPGMASNMKLNEEVAADYKAFPSHKNVGVLVQDSQDDLNRCTGTVIGKFVITAKHCIKDDTNLTESKIFFFRKANSKSISFVNEIITPEGYLEEQDIAVLILDQEDEASQHMIELNFDDSKFLSYNIFIGHRTPKSSLWYKLFDSDFIGNNIYLSIIYEQTQESQELITNYLLAQPAKAIALTLAKSAPNEKEDYIKRCLVFIVNDELRKMKEDYEESNRMNFQLPLLLGIPNEGDSGGPLFKLDKQNGITTEKLNAILVGISIIKDTVIPHFASIKHNLPFILNTFIEHGDAEFMQKFFEAQEVDFETFMSHLNDSNKKKFIEIFNLEPLDLSVEESSIL